MDYQEKYFFKKELISKGMQVDELKDKQKWINVAKKIWYKQYKNIGYGSYLEGEMVVQGVLEVINK
ncbi:hypothetical protein [Spartinivicinus ruber]|uniref:hypothetical protein n=1 Tax=Spartinivicinus ruber TaxID=2683272 RepID=UPI0013D324FE|nr:hypothetical protein [Spartinivicinus ruber]